MKVRKWESDAVAEIEAHSYALHLVDPVGYHGDDRWPTARLRNPVHVDRGGHAS